MTESRSPAATGAEPARVILGIDLGTTNSLAAVVGGKRPIVLRDRDGEALIPSVVAFRTDGTIAVGREAKALALELPDRTVHSVKRLIGRSGADVAAEARHLPYPVEVSERGLPRITIDGRAWSPEEISALILRKVKETAEAALSTSIRDAVVTVPAYFDDAQRQATKDAAELAGLRCLRIVNEPTAASLAYGIDGSRDGLVLVYDLGGGTFDVSILKIQDGVFRVLSTLGDTHLGGDDFDRQIAERILAAVTERTGDRRAPSPFVLQAVRRSAEGMKVRLSSEPSATLNVDLGDTQIEQTVTRDEFEAWITPWIDKTLELSRRAVADAGTTFDRIDEVVLVGGSTRIPLVRAAIERLTGRKPHTALDPDLTVALGAAVQADILAGHNRSLLLLDVIPLSLGIETMGGAFAKLILRNATIPTSHTEEFSTQVDGQSSVAIHVFQGEREMAADCRHLGSFHLRGIPPMPAGLPRIAVTFLVDADGVLRVSAKEQRTGLAASIQIVPSFGLTRDEVRRLMHESIENAESDVQRREAIDLRNKAKAMVSGTQRALELADLPADQTFSIRRATKRLDQLLARDVGTEGGDAGSEAAQAWLQELRTAVDELSRMTAQVADDVIGAAVKKALSEGP